MTSIINKKKQKQIEDATKTPQLEYKIAAQLRPH